MKKDFDKESDKTLNDKYPDNKGIFYYMGTRAENKWILLYNEKSFLTSCNTYIDSADTYTWNNDYNLEDTEYPRIYPYFIDDFTAKTTYSIDNYMVEDSCGSSITFTTITEDNKSCSSCCHPSIFNFYSDDYTNYNNNLKKTYIISSITSGDCCHCSPYDVECTPYLNTSSCQCSYLPDWNDCNEYCSCSGDSGCTSGCCKTPLDAFIYDTYNEFSLYPSVQKKKRCESCDNDYENTDLDDDCKNCHNYLIENEYFERDIDISDFEYETYNEGYQLNITEYYEITTDNGFLIYDRTCNGYTVDTWKQGDNLTLYGIKKEYKGNLFIYMNRTCTGYTIDNINELEINKEADYDYQKDLYRNAFALQITDDGRIGYRYLTKNCDATSADTIQYQILSGFSSSGLVKNDKWYTINVRVISLNDNMKLYFYINGKLKFISKELPKFNFKSLNEIYSKQEGVPYNISIGGGSQGLCDVIMPNYMKLYNDTVYPIEKNFAGSFIGYFRKFRFYNCKMEYMYIYNNYLYENNLIKLS
jgi:hypothetical protein